MRVCNLSDVPADDSEQRTPGVDLENLAHYVNTHRPELFDGPLTAEVISGGRSNLTYFVTDGSRTVVLRRPPLGHVLDTAHDMAREFRVISALTDTDVPVATPIALCEDLDVLGSPFYLMEKVEGLVLRDFDDAMELGAAAIPALSYRLVNTLGHLHAINPNDVGLADFGRPNGFLERQIRRWTKQLDASRSREVPGIDALAAKLAKSIPTTQRNTIVH
ncbi:MAG: phosphotransferase family protein, partial [Actinobacteria bacterium]|nr:phosphotransferase family protein [Actinomycetota bacterium]